jgi:hypothetical protein
MDRTLTSRLVIEVLQRAIELVHRPMRDHVHERILRLAPTAATSFLSREHTSLIYVSYSTDIVDNWLASKASNLESPRSERGVFPVTLLATNLGCAGGIRTRITLINSQVLCQLRYRAMLARN